MSHGFGVNIVDLGGSHKERQERAVRQMTKNWSILTWIRVRPSLGIWAGLVFLVGVIVGWLL